MKESMYKAQNGAISMFVMMAMLFFVITTIGIYMVSSKRAQTQTESIGLIQKQYNKEDETLAYNSKFATSSAIIPIYTPDQLWKINSGKYVEIDGVVYQFATNKSYKLQNDIIINIDDLKGATFNDTIANLNKNNFEIYYYRDGNYYVPTTGDAVYTDSKGNKFAYKN